MLPKIYETSTDILSNTFPNCTASSYCHSSTVERLQYGELISCLRSSRDSDCRTKEPVENANLSRKVESCAATISSYRFVRKGREGVFSCNASSPQFIVMQNEQMQHRHFYAQRATEKRNAEYTPLKVNHVIDGGFHPSACSI